MNIPPDSNLATQDFPRMHDVVFDATGKSMDHESLMKLFHSLPPAVKQEAYQWGLTDTVFGDRLYEHLESSQRHA